MPQSASSPTAGNNVPTTRVHFTARPDFPADLQILVLCSQGSKNDVSKSLSDTGRKATICTRLADALSTLKSSNVDVVLAEVNANPDIACIQSHLYGRPNSAVITLDVIALQMSCALSQDQLKAYVTSVPIILFNSSVTSKETWTAISYGAADIISFPFGRSQMLTLWKHTVRQHGPAPRATPKASASVIAQAVTVAPPVMKAATKTSTKALAPNHPDNKKRKIKDVSTAVVPIRPPIIKPAMVGMPVGATPQPQMVRYLTPANMPPPRVVPNAHLSWGHPVVGMPAPVPQPSVSFVPGHPQAWAHPSQFAAMRHAHVLPAVKTPPASAQMVVAHPAVPATPMQVPPQTCVVTDSRPLKVAKLPPPSPEASGDSASGSSVSDVSNFASMRSNLSEDDLMTIPEAGMPCSATSSVSNDHVNIDPTALDDIGDDEYAFIDFALSDDFPTYHEDEIIPPLGLTLKKSSSLVNMLNVQMPVF